MADCKICMKAIEALRGHTLHGYWVSLEPEIGLLQCSVCGHKVLRAKCNFCPSCGTKMDGDKSEID